MDFCTIASGSSGNCIYAGTDSTAVLVDVGMSGKKIEEGLRMIDRSPTELAGILITHEHIDHIAGLGVMARRYHLPLYMTRGTAAYIAGCVQMGKIDPDLIHIVRKDECFSVGDLMIHPFSISHDAAEPVGYRIEGGGKKIAVATDMGCYDEYTVEHLKDLDSLVLEANHDLNMLQVGPYPYPLKRRIMGDKGHLSNEHAGRLLGEILHDGMQTIFLGHLSVENNYEALAMATVTTEITYGDNPYRADDFRIQVAPRYTPSEMAHL